jgi:hypothetical protein
VSTGTSATSKRGRGRSSGAVAVFYVGGLHTLLPRTEQSREGPGAGSAMWRRKTLVSEP